jgi:hypothetical protein
VLVVYNVKIVLNIVIVMPMMALTVKTVKTVRKIVKNVVVRIAEKKIENFGDYINFNEEIKNNV